MSRQQQDPALSRASDATRVTGGVDAPSPFADVNLKNTSSNTNNIANVNQNKNTNSGAGILPYVLPYTNPYYKYPYYNYNYNPYYYPYYYPGAPVGNYAPQTGSTSKPSASQSGGVDPAILAALAAQQPPIAQTGGAVLTTPVLIASAFFVFALIGLVFYIKNRHKMAR
jgi:hypothetical protein